MSIRQIDKLSKPSWGTWPIGLAVALIIGAVYWQAPQLNFTNWDDPIHITRNERLNPVTPANVAYFWWHPNRSQVTRHLKPYELLYQPLTFTAWALLALAARLPAPRPIPGELPSTLDPQVFHIANVSVHILNALLVWGILRLLTRSWEQREETPPPPRAAREGACFLGALLWALHPAQVEPVAWITGFNNVLSGFFALGALWLHLRAGRAETTPRAARLLEIAAVASFILALLSKPTAALLPAIIWVLDVCILGRPARRAASSLLPWLIASLVTILAGSRSATDVAPFLVTSLWERPLLVLDAWGHYLAELILPLGLGVDYGHPPAVAMARFLAEPFWLLPCLLAGLAWWQRRRHPIILAAAAIFALATLSTSGIVPYYFHAYSTFADRYLYLAMLGPALVLTWWLRRPKLVNYGMATTVLLLWGLQSSVQVSTWQDSFTLWQHALVVNPNSVEACLNMASALGRVAQPRAAAYFAQRALQLEPNNGKGHMVLGLAMEKEGDRHQAMVEIGQALKLGLNDTNDYNTLGVSLAEDSHNRIAAMAFECAIALDPDDSESYNNLSKVQLTLGLAAEAEKNARRATQLAPDLPEARFNLAHALSLLGRSTEAAAQLKYLLVLDPSNKPARQVLAAMRR